jgi:hypothetical protein
MRWMGNMRQKIGYDGDVEEDDAEMGVEEWV